jgi:hypothetical protein
MVTQAEYARHRDCSREAVRKAVEAGRIKAFGPDKLIDIALADAQWARNTRARVGSGQRPAESAAAAVHDPGEVGDDAPQESYESARRRRELAEAALAELKLLELRGDLVRVAAVRTEVAKLAAGLQQSLMQLPARLAPVLAAEAVAATVHDLLVTELRQVLEQVTDIHPEPEPQ